MMKRLLAATLAALAMMPGCLEDIGIGGTSVGAVDLVSGKQYKRWVIEVDTMSGMSPPGGVLDLLRGRMVSMVDKPDGVDIVVDDTLGAEARTWDAEAIVEYSRQHVDHESGGKTAVTHLLFLAGTYEARVEGATVLGVQVDDQRGVKENIVAIFADSIRETCRPLALPPCQDPTPVWEAVVVHEFGHAIGLVNAGLPMQQDHEDDEHPAHSTNQNSVMYYQVETGNVLNFFTGGPPDNFDTQDRADACAAGGKC
jgi:hypothetical protein